ncbi:unnamed protein product [Caretta caretta]
MKGIFIVDIKEVCMGGEQEHDACSSAKQPPFYPKGQEGSDPPPRTAQLSQPAGGIAAAASGSESRQMLVNAPWPRLPQFICPLPTITWKLSLGQFIFWDPSLPSGFIHTG